MRLLRTFECVLKPANEVKVILIGDYPADRMHYFVSDPIQLSEVIA